MSIYNASLDRYLVFLSVFGNETIDTLEYRIYDASLDSIFPGEGNIRYVIDDIIGQIEDPFLFRNREVATRTATPALELEVFEVFPNPAGAGRLNLLVTRASNTPLGPLSLLLIDARGSKVLEKQLGGSMSQYTGSVNVSGWPPGLYYLVLAEGQKTAVRKVVIQ